MGAPGRRHGAHEPPHFLRGAALARAALRRLGRLQGAPLLGERAGLGAPKRGRFEPFRGRFRAVSAPSQVQFAGLEVLCNLTLCSEVLEKFAEGQADTELQLLGAFCQQEREADGWLYYETYIWFIICLVYVIM